VQNQQPESNRWTLQQKIAFSRWVAFFPALTAMVVLRRNLGYRTLSPVSLICVTAVMALLSVWASASTRFAEILLIFAGIVLLGGFAERAKRYKEMREGTRVHSHYIGDSHLRSLPLPQFLKRDRRLERVVDPIVMAAAGVLLFQISPIPAMWLALSGASLRLIEADARKRQIERELDTLDSMVEAEIQEEVIEHYSVRIHNPTDRPVNGIPTGCSADIQKTILRRTKRVPRE
jgi:hypothetical protein